MTRFRWLPFTAVALAAVTLPACGGDGGDSKNNNDTSPVVQAGEPLDDEAYLRVFCTGLTEYQDALMTATTVDQIGEVVERYVANLREVNPPEDLRDFTFMLSNFGMIAGRYATPVVVPPAVAILGAGRLSHDVVAVMGGIEAHLRMPLSLTFDHRCITGGEAARFLAAVLRDLERGS